MVVVSDIVRNGIRKKQQPCFWLFHCLWEQPGAAANNPAETQSPGRIQDPTDTGYRRHTEPGRDTGQRRHTEPGRDTGQRRHAGTGRY